MKGAKFEKHQYVGDPVNAVRIFNDKFVDELIFLDINATNEGRSPDFELIKDIASQAFMPLGYGGGLHTLKDVERLFGLGIEKAILNTAAIFDPNLIHEASTVAGSQSIVVSIDVKRDFLGRYRVFTNSGKRDTNIDPIEYAKKVEECGAGEILLCSIDREGTGIGYDLDLIRRVSSVVNIPIVACGGAGQLPDFVKAIDNGASSVAAGNMFTFYGKHKAVLLTYPEYSVLKLLFEEKKPC